MMALQRTDEGKKKKKKKKKKSTVSDVGSLPSGLPIFPSFFFVFSDGSGLGSSSL